ncbi:MAG TPA: gliding motility-associated ABC transporter permease subunit GldF [Cyclobacteriaceae bacterium]|nr:gliding motility-associated ABC transporter permease subunit GldF [Cyclobacteriaceae bacterium]HRJ81073.1 gliding motility-associated ABC transporter permease subunit GldF [Cyclobacteriaceae bacterium]
MIHILIKEFNGFLNSLIAYIVIGVFLTAIGLLMWVFPETSVLEYGYADMDTLFSLAPYVYIFLIPAITMRSFSEEKRAGTMELLLTRPLSDWDIIIGKYLAGFLLVIFSILPTLIYYFSIRLLGDPQGNVDTSGVIGSYIGLILLGGVFCAVGIFASSITPNQIVAFIVAAFLCFIVFTGFDSISTINVWASNALVIKQLGILYHYQSMGKGLVDSRDLIYFFSVAFIFLLFTKLIIGSRSW